jgi:hypothetical protein
MSRRLWTGLLVGLVAAIGLLAVGAGAYHAGEHHSAPAATVAPGTATTPDGTVVRVVGIDHWRGGPPFGFLFPLLFIGLIVALVAGRRRAYWGRPGGPGAYGFAEWHRHAHEEQPAHEDHHAAPPSGQDG